MLYIPPTLKYEAYVCGTWSLYFIAVYIVLRIVVVLIVSWITVADASGNISAVLNIVSLFIIVLLSLKLMEYTMINIVRYSNTIIVNVH